MEHLTKVRPIKIRPPQDGLERLLGVKEDTDLPKMPDATHFYAIPESKPHLRSFIRSFQWNCVSKEIEMVIDETPAISAYGWFSNLNDWKDKPGTRQDKESIALVMLDEDQHEVSRLGFVGIELISHRCGLRTPEDCELCEGEGEFEPVRHWLLLKYEKSGLPQSQVEYEDEPDTEWSVTDLRIAVDEESEKSA